VWIFAIPGFCSLISAQERERHTEPEGSGLPLEPALDAKSRFESRRFGAVIPRLPKAEGIASLGPGLPVSLQIGFLVFTIQGCLETRAAFLYRSICRYRMAKKSTTPSVPPRSLTGFIEAFARYSSSSTYLKCFRGQRDSSWPNVAGIFRPDLKALLENEKRAVRDLISVQPHEFASDETMFDRLVRMQHFGLPTRLLDVSRNALVALYFATDPGPDPRKPRDGMVIAFAIPPKREKYFDSDSVSCLANLANMTSEEKDEIYQLRKSLKGNISSTGNIDKFNEKNVIKRLHQFIRSEKPYFLPIIDPIDLFKPYYVHPKMSNRRILAQSSAFILYGIDPPKKMYFPDPIEPTSFIVPQSDKSRIRQELENLGINESTLFPEIDKAATRIKNYYTM